MDYTGLVEFEWDKKKSDLCLAHRGFDFHYVVRVFADPNAIVRSDTRRDYGEDRFELIGKVGQRVFVVVYTRRFNAIRVISARRANQREVGRYDSHSSKS